MPVLHTQRPIIVAFAFNLFCSLLNATPYQQDAYVAYDVVESSLVLACLLQAFLVLAESLSFLGSQLTFDFPLPICEFRVVTRNLLQLGLHII